MILAFLFDLLLKCFIDIDKIIKFRISKILKHDLKFYSYDDLRMSPAYTESLINKNIKLYGPIYQNYTLQFNNEYLHFVDIYRTNDNYIILNYMYDDIKMKCLNSKIIKISNKKILSSYKIFECDLIPFANGFKIESYDSNQFRFKWR